jgi:hypothetical protein
MFSKSLFALALSVVTFPVFAKDTVAQRLYIARTDAVMVIDLRTRLVTAALVPSERGHAALAIPGTSDVISACTNGVAKVSCPYTREVASLTIGPRTDGTLYDPGRHLAFIPSSGNGTLSIIRLSP